MATPFFPSTINPPDQDGYEYDSAAETVITKLEGGRSRIRRDFFGASHIVQCKWSCTADQYTQIKGFFRERIQSRSTLFRIPLLIDAPFLFPYLAQLVDKPDYLSRNQGLLYEVTAVLEVIPNPIRTFSAACQSVSDHRVIDNNTGDYNGDITEFPIGRQIQLFNCKATVDGVPINLDGTYTINTHPISAVLELGAAQLINPDWTALRATATQSFNVAAGGFILVPL